MSEVYFARIPINKTALKKHMRTLHGYCSCLGFTRRISTWDERLGSECTATVPCAYTTFHPPAVFSGQDGVGMITLCRDTTYSERTFSDALQNCTLPDPISILSVNWRVNEQSVLASVEVLIDHTRRDYGKGIQYVSYFEFSRPFPRGNNLFDKWVKCYSALLRDLWNYETKLADFDEGAKLPQPEFETMEKLGREAEFMHSEELIGCFKIPKLTPEAAVHIIKKAINLLNDVVGAPTDMRLTQSMRTEEFLAYSKQLDSVPWTSFDTSYRMLEGFDVFNDPLPSGVQIEVYPQFVLQRYDFYNVMLPHIALLSVNLVKTDEGCFLELQSSRSVEWVEFAAHLIGRPIEIWEGLANERWGWYEPARDINAIRIYDPTGKPALRPHYDPPGLRNEKHENEMFDFAESER